MWLELDCVLLVIKWSHQFLLRLFWDYAGVCQKCTNIGESCGIEHTVCCINEEKKSQLWWIFYPCLIGNNVLKDLLSVVFEDIMGLNTGTWILNLSVLQTHYTHIP